MLFLKDILHLTLDFVDTLLVLYTWVIVIDVILGWVKADPTNPIVHLIHTLTRPILRHFQRWLRPVTYRLYLDFSPLLALFLIQVVRIAIRHLRFLLLSPFS